MFKNHISQFSLVALGLVVALAYQNCGEFQSSESASLVTDVPESETSFDEAEESINIISKSKYIDLWQDQEPLKAYISESELNRSPSSAAIGIELQVSLNVLNLEYSSSSAGEEPFTLSLFLPEGQSFAEFHVFVVEQQVSFDSEKANLYLVNDSLDQLVSVELFQQAAEPLWAVDFAEPLQVEQLDSYRKVMEEDESESLFFGDYKIEQIESRDPAVFEIPDCPEGTSLDDKECVDNVIACTVANGTGEQTWDGAKYGICTVKTCNSGYKSENNKCVLDCKPDEHIEGDKCVSNIKSCSVANGSGEQTWDGAKYGICTVKTCNSGYKSENNQCVLDCKSDEHIEGGKCVSNIKSCSVANGTGEQTWDGAKYGACTVKTCNAGYKSENNKCVLDCKSDEHIEGDKCVSNIKSCSVANGTGEQRWDGAKYGACTVKTCRAGYKPQNNQCVLQCAADQVLYNGSCIAARKACTVSNGSGEQFWQGAAYGECKVRSCNAGYEVNGDKCQKVCRADQTLYNGNCYDNKQACNYANGFGERTWEGTKYGACELVSCYHSYKVVNGSCQRVCPGAQYLVNGQCVSYRRECRLPNGNGTQVWSYRDAEFGECRYLTSCDSGYQPDAEKKNCIPKGYPSLVPVSGLENTDKEKAKKWSVLMANQEGLDPKRTHSFYVNFIETVGSSVYVLTNEYRNGVSTREFLKTDSRFSQWQRLKGFHDFYHMLNFSVSSDGKLMVAIGKRTSGLLENEIYFSKDGGKTVEVIDQTTGTWLTSAAFSKNGKRIAIYGFTDKDLHGLDSYSHTRVHFSNDGGKSWSVKNFPYTRSRSTTTRGITPFEGLDRVCLENNGSVVGFYQRSVRYSPSVGSPWTKTNQFVPGGVIYPTAEGFISEQHAWDCDTKNMLVENFTVNVDGKHGYALRKYEYLPISNSLKRVKEYKKYSYYQRHTLRNASVYLSETFSPTFYLTGNQYENYDKIADGPKKEIQMVHKAGFYSVLNHQGNMSYVKLPEWPFSEFNGREVPDQFPTLIFSDEMKKPLIHANGALFQLKLD